VPTPITQTNPLPPPPPNSTRSHHRNTDPLPQPLVTSSTQAQSGGIQKDKGKWTAHQLAQPLVLPNIFITPEPHHGFVPQILKDQAKANKANKKRHTRQDPDRPPSWGDLPDNWDFDQYNNWDANPGTD